MHLKDVKYEIIKNKKTYIMKASLQIILMWELGRK